jgi:hypothetical protein
VDRSANEPLTVEMAKARLRATAARVGVRPWIQRHPMQTLVIAAASGFVAGRSPDLPRVAAFNLVRGVIRSLLLAAP